MQGPARRFNWWFRRHAQDAFAVAEALCIRDLRQALRTVLMASYPNALLGQKRFGAYGCDYIVLDHVNRYPCLIASSQG